MSLRVSVDITEAVAGLHELEHQHLPYAVAATLTTLAKGAQGKVREGLQNKFKLRNEFTKQGIRIKPAEKNSSRIEADVHTDTANRTTGAPDYLGKQEDGGERVAIGGRSHIAIPTRYLREMIGERPIPAELRPKALLTAVNGRYTARTRKGQLAIKNQTRVNGMVFFLAPDETNPKWIMGRYWTDRDAFPFYTLATSVTTRPRLEMDKDVETYVMQNFGNAWREQWEKMRARGLKFT
jgi:hypothetical protein